jgi:nucleoside-diphosphate-sugar epimerase
MLQPKSPMKIVLLGAKGYVGSVTHAEAHRRGHTITAIARLPESVPLLQELHRCAAMPPMSRPWLNYCKDTMP